MSGTIRAVNIRNGKGPAEALFIDDTVPKPTLKAGQALVEVKAFGLNRMDLVQRSAFYPIPPGASEILGVEFAGVIKEIHPEGTSNLDDGAGKKFAVGDRVLGLISGGAYSELVAAPLKTLLHLPEQMPFTEGAGIPQVWFTAYQVLKVVGGLSKDQSLLIHAGASGVGIAAIQIAQIIGARRIFATVGSDDKKDFIANKLRLKGTADGVIVPINYHTEDFVEVIKKIEPRGIDVTIDPVGPSYFAKNIAVAGLDGTIVIIGAMSGNVFKDEVDIRLILGKRLSIVGSTLRSRTLDYQQQLRDFLAQVLLPKIVSKEVTHSTEKVFEFNQIVEAHKVMESNKTMGKLIVKTN
ncbi:hypothetical protein AWJ20_1371 [Sugiyamaella lignohabitans]|uniref:Enoyl reductase (ER) domain-containing protein n=1 Tax=Sugiyamaella lignohabitans TaxID=796027 RepID=A0A167DN33_9ASCO|nr:uncharacterized protein AWJ20_1371 [Sugiyamaella lignohabitans]ANB13092.1 hypothetical protein AWJ20_1371 [Sugiyamaella lignohabitans]